MNEFMRRANYQSAEKSNRLKEILATLKKAKDEKKTVSFTKFVAELCIVYGLQKRKVLEYCETLRDHEDIEINSLDDTITRI